MKHLALAALFILPACGGESADSAAPEGGLSVDSSDVRKVEPGKADTSAEAVIIDMAFSGSVVTTSSWNLDKQIEDQMLYTVGQLNGSDAVGRLDKVVLTNVESEQVDGKTRITYDASLQVAWRKTQPVPEKYTFKLPRDVSYQGQQDFTEKYSHTCVDRGAHDVTSGSMWYYYRPNESRCSLEAEHIMEASATVSISDVNTTGKYPEYHRIWEDGVFVVVAVFGKYEDGATTASDAGIRAYNEFAGEIRGMLRDNELQTEPADAPTFPGSEVPEITYSARLDADHRIVVYTLLVDNVKTAGAEFDARYAELSKNADLIVYNGHAGLGSNIRALARKGDWQPGQYSMVFMNGCDTYAYVDSAIFDAHAAVNPDDPDGTLHADVITNALPAFFASMSEATMALINGITNYDEPATYEQIFKAIDRSQIVLVSGEHDNEFVPGMGEGEPTAAWPGLSLEGALTSEQEQRFETGVVPAGTYAFTMTGSGDADLYIRTGSAPTTGAYDCRPYKGGSREACTVTLPAPANIHGMVRGYSATSNFELVAAPE